MTSIKRNPSFKKAIEDAETAVVSQEDLPEQSTIQIETENSKFAIAELEKDNTTVQVPTKCRKCGKCQYARCEWEHFHEERLQRCLLAHEVIDEILTRLERVTLKHRGIRLPQELMRKKLEVHSTQELKIIYEEMRQKVLKLLHEEQVLERLGVRDIHPMAEFMKSLMQDFKMWILNKRTQFRRRFSKKEARRDDK
ncbi:hypothetical protein GCK72_008362 [Caenorhabditis remanei]|uniref:Uncharacterized protein n=1 Tax=Caenorhabditis remanei TaxID=31234 RepID=A0A6A5H028_CAERE|nr:hypothetical protein GCK72_008362 [Caenorhabditis remanei]KAF1760116.1 hypothetical protein GCK72_008362 [Caenorhabditis remanei]